MEQITKNFNNGENDVANDSQADLESLNAVKCDVWPTTSVQCQKGFYLILIFFFEFLDGVISQKFTFELPSQMCTCEVF